MIYYLTILSIPAVEAVQAKAEQLRGIVDLLSDADKKEETLKLMAIMESVQFAHAQILASAGPPTHNWVTQIIGFHKTIMQNNIGGNISNLEKLLDDIDTGTENQQRGHLQHVINNCPRILNGLRGILQTIDRVS